jgi:hypothetical protein
LKNTINFNLRILVQMKKLLIFLLLSVGINAQFNYQALVKHSSGGVISNNQVKIKLSLMYDSSAATPIFIEEHDITIPDDGVVNLSVGGGTVLDGTFSDLDWSRSVFMKEELDTGSGYQDMGTRQIASVPVAEFAKSLSGFESDEMLDNIRIGDGALLSITSASGSSIASTGNIAIGKSALSSNTTGNSNIAIGIMTLKDNIQGFANIGIGGMSLSSNVSGVNNVGIGYSSLRNNQAKNNVGIGNSSLGSNVSGEENVAIGSSSLYSNRADGNTAVGHNSLVFNVTGFNNTAIGENSMYNNESGEENAAIGGVSLYSNVDGNANIAVGQGALYYNTSGSENAALGYNSLNNIEENYNTGIGSYAGTSLISGTLNTAIGYRSDISNNLTNATAIGANSIVTTSNTIQLGDSNVTQINTSGVVSATDFILSGDSVGNILGSLSSTQSDIASLSSQIDALLAAVDDLDIQTNSLSSTLSESNTSEIKSAQVVITSNDVVLFELGVLRFSWNNTYNTIQVKQSSTSEIVDNWFISGVIRSGGSDGEYTPTEKYIQKTNMTYGIGDDGGGNDFFTPIWNNGPSSLMGGSIALGSGYSNFEFYITPMGSGSTPPYDPAPTWQLRGHVDGYNQLTVTCVHVKFDGTSGW